MREHKITVGLDAKRAVSNATGLGSYARTLINDLTKTNSGNDFSFLLYAPDKGKENLVSQINKDTNLQFVYPKQYKMKLLRDLWREKGIVKDLIRDKVDIFHGLSGQLPHGIKASGIKSVVTIHDLIFFVHPEFYNPIDVWIYKQKFFSALKEADKIIAISECTKRDILRFGNTKGIKPLVSEDKIQVIYQSYNKIFDNPVSEEKKAEIKRRLSLPDRFILSVGTVESRKNILLCVKAMEEVSDDVHLVIVGKNTAYTRKVIDYVNSHNLHERVHIYNNVSNEELKTVYSLAEIFVYPSLYEGFGIPVIEAIANNLPVIAAKGSCLEEAGGEYSFYIDPFDVKDAADMINMLLNSKDKRLTAVNKSKEYIKKFSDTHIADKISALYQSVIAQ
ncbi:MAG: glycosyltransferase family 4 protein [Bacteroidales bacterium]|nr:glycosyltransferase family 4 protein [Bacteroidales bacterium]